MRARLRSLAGRESLLLSSYVDTAARTGHACLRAQEHQGVAKLTFIERGPVTGVDVSSWEQKNSGCVLPEDLKALLQISDGMTLKWDAKLHGAPVLTACGASVPVPCLLSGLVVS